MQRPAGEGSHFTREGTADFESGEEAHVVVHVVQGPGSSWANGTSKGDAIYSFKDGSGFKGQFEGSWNSVEHRQAGIFVDGKGRFAGITGKGAASGEAPTSATTSTFWKGTYT